MADQCRQGRQHRLVRRQARDRLHTDSPYEEVPPRLAILHAKEVPSQKGGTMFADMRAAYEALDEAMKRRLEGLVGLHGRHDGPAGVRLYDGDPEQTLDRAYSEKARPAVIRHMVTGRPILFVNPLHTHGFEGMTRDEAWRLIEELAEHSTQDHFVYYHSWRVGDVLMWDEQATMHRGAGDYRPNERRIMLRTIVYPNSATHRGPARRLHQLFYLRSCRPPTGAGRTHGGAGIPARPVPAGHRVPGAAAPGCAPCRSAACCTRPGSCGSCER